MTSEEFFKDWYPYIDTKALNKTLLYLLKEKEYYPNTASVFKAFTMCEAKDTVAVFLGQDPYPQKDRATGILFGNPDNIPENKISPSLRVLKESVINYEIPHRPLFFDNTLESWAKQGILMLNSSLTVKPNLPGSHSLYWRPVITYFLKTFSFRHTQIVYVLFGKQAQSFKPYIYPFTSKIIEVEHPAALARKHEKLPYGMFKEIQDYIYDHTGNKIQWFNE